MAFKFDARLGTTCRRGHSSIFVEKYPTTVNINVIIMVSLTFRCFALSLSFFIRGTLGMMRDEEAWGCRIDFTGQESTAVFDEIIYDKVKIGIALVKMVYRESHRRRN